MAQSTPALEGQTSDACSNPSASRFAVFDECPQCGGGMTPEHAHYRCQGCGWRDSCCD